jgi:hypothetical protein
MKRPWRWLTVVLVVFCWIPVGSASEWDAGIVLQPENPGDQELSDDLTEVLISAIIEGSGRKVRVIGKERVRTQLGLADSGHGFCVSDAQCLRRVRKELGLSILAVGRVGKIPSGYRLNVLWLGSRPQTDRVFGQRDVADLGALIEVMSEVAQWILREEDAALTVTVVPEDAQVFVNGVLQKGGVAVAVAPGKVEVRCTHPQYAEKVETVTCASGVQCAVQMSLAGAGKVLVPVKPDEGTVSPDKRSSLLPWVYVLGGVAVVSAGGSVFFYSVMSGKSRDIAEFKKSHCPGDVCDLSESEFRKGIDPMKKDGESAALWSNVLGGVAVGTAVAATALLVVDLVRKPSKTGTSIHVLPSWSPDGSGVSLHLSF